MIGNTLLLLALAASVFTVIMYYLTYKGYSNTKSLARIGYHSTAILIIAASALLIHAILTHQYQYEYVYEYSGSGLSTGLLISTFWGGQQGSFMLWIFFTSIVGLILLDYTAKRGDLEERTMMVFSLVIAFLLILVSPLLKSPFNYIWSEPLFLSVKNINSAFLSMPFMQNHLFRDPNNNQSFVRMSSDLYATLASAGISLRDFIIQGKGLNPLLQNFWMQIHPPFLFLGFALSAVPYSFAIAALIKNDYRDWIKQSFPWLLTGTMILGLAIMLGGYWAYGVLGWGGYWGWDPVENSSFIPWLIGVAAIHTFLIQKKSQSKGESGRFLKTNLILSIFMFVLVLYSTFLTRSGILGDSSVHSFVAPGMLVYLFLIILMVTFLMIGVIGIIYRWKFLERESEYKESLLSRELALFTGSIALIAASLIIIVGTSAPIFGRAVEVRFYNDMTLPIAIIIGLLNGFSLLLKWKSNEGISLLKNSIPSLIVTVILTAVIIILGGVNNIMLGILTLSSIFALVVNVEIAFKIIKGKKLFLGAYIAHTGIALFLLGVVATAGFTQERQLDLEKGKTIHSMGYDLTFLGYKPIEDGKKFAFNVQIKKGNDVSVVSPVMFFSDFNGSLMREPDIYTTLTKDFYITPLSYSDGSEQRSDKEKKISLKKGETTQYKGKSITFDKFDFPKTAISAMMDGGDFEIGAIISVAYNGRNFTVEPKLKNENGKRFYVPVTLKDVNLKINLLDLNAEGVIELILSPLNEENNIPQVTMASLSVEASVKPFISFVWIGVLIMVLGFIISVIRRTKESVK
ncbi:cytochrome c-type biogenesis protein CcmF [bacterium BMS3Abin04]|nr:cytochrome c-type biogenesis protein CcmF [bacterium BMS3Abin04]